MPEHRPGEWEHYLATGEMPGDRSSQYTIVIRPSHGRWRFMLFAEDGEMVMNELKTLSAGLEGLRDHILADH